MGHATGHPDRGRHHAALVVESANLATTQPKVPLAARYDATGFTSEWR